MNLDSESDGWAFYIPSTPSAFNSNYGVCFTFRGAGDYWVYQLAFDTSEGKIGYRSNINNRGWSRWFTVTLQ